MRQNCAQLRCCGEGFGVRFRRLRQFGCEKENIGLSARRLPCQFKYLLICEQCPDKERPQQHRPYLFHKHRQLKTFVFTIVKNYAVSCRQFSRFEILPTGHHRCGISTTSAMPRAGPSSRQVHRVAMRSHLPRSPNLLEDTESGALAAI